DHPRDVPGPPHVIAVYAFGDPEFGDRCGLFANADPRVYGGNFVQRDAMQNEVPIRCVPDLTRTGSDAMSFDHPAEFTYNVQLQWVFNELLDGDKIEVQDNVALTSKLNANVFAAPSTATPLPSTAPAVSANTEELNASTGATLLQPSYYN